MQFQMRAVGLDFIATARRTWTVESVVRAPRSVVWQAYVDPSTWPDWFPGVRSASYTSPEPYGVGARRVADVSGRHFEEIIVAWDEGKRWAYYIKSAAAPLAHAQLECTEFEDAPDGTLLRWTIAADPRLLLWLATPVFETTVRRLFSRACNSLEAHLRARPGP